MRVLQLGWIGSCEVIFHSPCRVCSGKSTQNRGFCFSFPLKRWKQLRCGVRVVWKIQHFGFIIQAVNVMVRIK